MAAALRDRRRRLTPGERPIEGGRRIRDHPYLSPRFDRVLVSISDQIYALQGRKGATLQQLVEGSGLSDRGLLDIFKTLSDPKVSTLVRIADFFDCEIAVSFRPKSGAAGTVARTDSDGGRTRAMLRRTPASPGKPRETDESPTGGP